jgi:hypothetical protein
VASERETRTCARCGRDFAWRRKWKSSWATVRYCSERCRRTRPGRTDLALEDAIRSLLAARHGTICPSEAARAVAADSWRALMERTRMAGRRLAARGEVVVLQGGRKVDPSSALGPIRLGRGPAFGSTRRRSCPSPTDAA